MNILLDDYSNLWIRSRMKFSWDFHKLLKELVSELEDNIRKQIVPNYWVKYTQYGDYFIKVKVKDENLMSEKLIVCTLDYSKNDERYWYVIPKFTSAEISQKTKKYELEKFTITDNENIVKAIISKLKEIIEEF